MTTSGGSKFKITPKRSAFENLAAQPARPTLEEGAPAQPNREQYRRGGSLYDKSTFQPDRRAGKAIDSIEEFLNEETGEWAWASAKGFDEWKKGASERADKIRAGEDYLGSAGKAYIEGRKNAEATKELRDKGEYELAKANRLNDPWTNFYYWDSVAQDAGRDAAIELHSKIIDNLDFLADLDPTEVGIEIQKYSDSIKSGKAYTFIPKAAVAARIDPFLANISVEGKVKVNERRTLLKEITDINAFNGKTNSGLVSASKLLLKGASSDTTDQLILTTFENGRNFLINTRGYSPQEATDFLAAWIKEGYYVDVDEDGVNDIGQHIDSYSIRKALKDYKIDGVPFLELRDSDKVSLSKHLMDAQSTAMKLAEQIAVTRVKRLDRNLNNKKQQFIKEAAQLFNANKSPTDKQILEWRINAHKKLTEFFKSEAGKDSKQLSQKEMNTFLTSLYPDSSVLQETPKGMKVTILGEAELAISNGATEIPPSLLQAMTVPGTDGMYYDVYYDVVKKFYAAQSDKATKTTTAITNHVTTDLTSLKADVKQELSKSNDLLKALTTGNRDSRELAKNYLDQVSIKVNSILEREATILLQNEYKEAVKADLDINDPKVRTQVYTKVFNKIKNSPFLTDIDSWMKPVGVNQLSMRAVPHIGDVEVNDGNNTPHKINVVYADGNGAIAGNFLHTIFAGKPEEYLNHVSKNSFVLPESHLKAWTKVFSHYASNTPIPDNLITKEMREALNNMSTVASGGTVSPAAVLQAQLKLYEGRLNNRGMDENDYKKAFDLLGSTTHSVDATNVSEDSIDTSSISAIPITKIVYGNNEYAMDFTLTKGDDQQTSNEMPSPVNGEVVHIGKDTNHGNFIVIRANSDSPFNNKGDLIKVSNLANINATVGQTINRGSLIGTQGNDSDINSEEGSTTGNNIQPGHLNLQIFQPSDDVNPSNDFQYSQTYQNRFFRGMVQSLYNNQDTSDSKRAIRYVNPRDYSQEVQPTIEQKMDYPVGVQKGVVKQRTIFDTEKTENRLIAIKSYFRYGDVSRKPKSRVEAINLWNETTGGAYTIEDLAEGRIPATALKNEEFKAAVNNFYDAQGIDSYVHKVRTSLTGNKIPGFSLNLSPIGSSIYPLNTLQYSWDGGNTWTTKAPSKKAILAGEVFYDMYGNEVDMSKFPGGVKIEYGENGDITNIIWNYTSTLDKEGSVVESGVLQPG